MARRGYIDTDPNIAIADQNRANALDWLRSADKYVLIVPAPPEAEAEGAIALLASADGEFLLKAHAALTESIGLTAAKIMLDDAEDGGES